MSITLNPQQKKFTQSELGDCKLVGSVGCGKTTAVIYKIIHQFTMKHFKTKADFLVITSSKKLKNDFLLNGANIQKNLFSDDNVKTFYSLGTMITQKIADKQCTSPQITMVSATKIINKSSSSDLLKIKCLKNIKAIIVDNAEDMSQVQYELILDLKKKLNISLVLAGDPNQSIEQCSNKNGKYLTEFDGNEYYLNENTRSSPEIVKFINYFAPWNTKYPATIPGLQPVNKKPIIFTETADNICIRILNEIKNTNYPLENIAIIGAMKKTSSSSKINLHKITNFLDKHNIKFVKHYDDKTQKLPDNDVAVESGKINICTIYDVKGLEFDKVILVNFHLKTFDKTPSLEEYNTCKYLWYVALGRAKYELLVCVDCDNSCFNELQICPSNLYEIQGDEPTFKSFEQKTTEIYENVTNILSNEEYFDKKKLLDLYESVNISESVSQIFTLNIDIECDDCMIEQFMKYILEYYYCLFTLSPIGFVDRIEKFVSNIIFVGVKYEQSLSNIFAKSNIDSMSTLSLLDLEQYKNNFNSSEKKLYEIIKRDVNYNITKKFSLGVKRDDIFIDKNTICELCDDVKSGEDVELNIFKLALFEYQYVNNVSGLWGQIEKSNVCLGDLNEHIQKIIRFAVLLSLKSQKLKFNKRINHPNLPLFCNTDIIFDDGEIVLIKFTDDENISQNVIIQLVCFLTYHCLHNKWNFKKKVEVWNFKSGKKYVIGFEPHYKNIDISIFIAEACKKKLKNMVFVYDLETTGLNVRTCEIIERYFYEMCHNEVYTEGVICPKQRVQQFILDLTGITRKELKYGDNIALFAARMQKLTEACTNPLFIAHNGNVFDHRVMENNNYLNSRCKFLDSRMIIRQLSDNRIKNETLVDTYNIVLGKKYGGKAHRAKADVIMLLDIFEKLNINEYSLLKMI